MVKRKYSSHKGGVLLLEQHFWVNLRTDHLILVAKNSSLSDIITEAEQQGYIPEDISATYQSSGSPLLTTGHIHCKKQGENPKGRYYGIITSERVKSRTDKDIIYCFYIVQPNLPSTDSQTDKSL